MNIAEEKSAIFQPLYLRERLFCVLYGGRGGGKSWEIADYLLFDGIKNVNRNLCCREVQKSIKQSVHQLFKDRIKRWNLGQFYNVLETEIRGVNGTLFIYSGLLEHTSDTIKSFEGCNRTWIEEAQTVSKRSLDILIPTVVRTADCQVIMSLNPYLLTDAVWADYIQPTLDGKRDDVTLIRVNYTDNKHCPPEIMRLAENMRRDEYDQWLNIYDGQPKLVADGAIYKDELHKMRADGRITSVPVDDILPVYTVWDLGVSDSTVIWFVQVYGKEPRLVDYYEANGEGIDHYIKLIKSKGYDYGGHFAPHDIKVREFTSGKSRLETAKTMGIDFTTVTNISIDDGIDATRRLLKQVWIDERKCARGIECVQNYRREYNDKMQEFKPRPVHDWASHAADALRYVALSVDRMVIKKQPKVHIPLPSGGWQG